MASVIVELTGTVDGVNTVFTTPEAFLAGSFRPVINGTSYEQDDDRFGCVENSETQVTMTTAPLIGDVVQGFYIEKDAEGSPFDPDGAVP